MIKKSIARGVLYGQPFAMTFWRIGSHDAGTLASGTRNPAVALAILEASRRSECERSWESVTNLT